MQYSNYIREKTKNLTKIGEASGYPLILLKSKGKNLKDYKIYGNSIQSELSTDYQQVEYIESTGTQYFEIDYIANQSTNSKGKFQIIDTSKANFLFGARRGAAQGECYGFNWGGGVPYKYYNTYYGNSNDGMTKLSIDGEIHTFEKITNQLYIDNNLIHTRGDTDGTTEFTTPNNLIIFGCNTNGAIGLLTYARLFNLQLYDNNVLKINLIPCYRKTDNVIGMYDSVNNVFYTNQGTGEFLKGNDVDTTDISAINVSPTPENPIDIKSVGDKSTNILNPDFSKASTGTYSHTLLSDTSKVLTLRLIDRDTSVNITNVSFGFTGNGANANNGFHWCVAGGGIRDRFITNNTDNGDNSIQNPLMYFSVYPKSQATWEAVFKRFYIQIVEGEYTEATIPEYESYGYKIPVKVNNETINLYLDEPLRKSGNYADYVDFKNQKIIRLVESIVFNGSENWEKHTNITGGSVFRLDGVINPRFGELVKNTFMTHFQPTTIYTTAEFTSGLYRFTNARDTSLINGTRLYISTTHTTVEELKGWLSENKPELVYFISEEKNENTNLPFISTNKETNIIETETLITPSNMYAKYIKK